MEIYPDFREFFELFAAHDVRYLVVGGYALGFHGHPRYTGDLDVWVEPTPENSACVIAALIDFGFGSLELAPDAFAKDDVVVQLGREPVRIDILTTPSGVSFESCYPLRKVVDVEGLSVSVIGIEGFKANKAASGRPQDLADLDHVKHKEG